MVAITATATSEGFAASQPLATFSLKEPLDRDWPAEWIAFQTELRAGAVQPGELWLCESDGTAVEHGVWVESVHADGSASTVTVSVYTDLKAGEEKTFNLTRNSDLARERRSPLATERENEHLILISDRLEVAVPIGEINYQSPVDPEEVPPPIIAVRRPGRPWIAPSRLTGTKQIKAMRADQEPAPAHLLKYRIAYEFADGGSYEISLELPAHDPVLLVEEDFMDSATGALVIDLLSAFQPDTGHWRLHRPSPKKRKPNGKEHHYPLDFSESSTHTLQPFPSWYEDQAVWWGCYPSGGDDYVCLFTSEPTRWINPLVNLPRITTEPGPTLEARLPLRTGKRRWGIIHCSQEEVPIKKPDRNPIVYRIMIQHCESPLNKVKDLVFDWSGCDRIKYPRLLCDSENVPAIRRKAQTNPLFTRIFEVKPDGPRDPAGLYLATGDEAHAQQARDLLLEFLHRKTDDLLTNGYTSGGNVCIGHSRPVRDHTFVYDLIARSGAMGDHDRRFCRHAFTFLAYAMTDQNYWPTKEQGIPRGNINFHSDWYTCVVAVAGLLPGHPDFDRWLRWGESEMDLEFDRNVFPGGAWIEAPNYHQFSMHYLLLASVILKNAGFKDFSKDPRVRATMNYAMETQTPIDVRAGHAMLPTMGDTSSWYHSQSLQVNFAWMASLARDDPEFAGRMMYAWERTGRMLIGMHNLGPGAGWTYPLCLIDPGIPSVAPDPPLQSRRFPGFGAVMRNNSGTDRESLVLFKMGKAAHHYDNDEGTFHWYAHGIPLCLDFGNMYSPSVDQPWLHNTLAFNEQKTWSTGDVSQMNVFEGLDYSVGQITVQHVQPTSRMPGEEGPHEPIKYGSEWVLWRRQMMFVKGPDYLVIRDDLEDGRDRVPTEWSLQVLADRVETSPGRASFVGQLGMDLEVVFAQPEEAELRTGEWSHAGQEQPDWLTDFPLSAMGERQISLHARAPSNGDYCAVLFPYRHGENPPKITTLGPATMRVQHPGGDDLVFFADRWRTFEADGVRVSGRVALVRRLPEKTIVWLPEGDGVELPGFYFTCQGPLSLEIGKDSLRGETEGAVRILSGKWADYPGIPAVTVGGERQECDYTPDGFFWFHLPEGNHRFEIRYQPDVNVWEF